MNSLHSNLIEYPWHIIINLGINTRPVQRSTEQRSERNDSNGNPFLTVLVPLHQRTTRITLARVFVEFTSCTYLSFPQGNTNGLVGLPAGAFFNERQLDLEFESGFSPGLGFAPARNP